MKRIFLFLFLLVVIVGIGAAWVLLGPATGFSANKSYLYIGSRATTKQAVLDSLEKNKIIRNKTAFSWLANQLGYWDKIKPGKYEIDKGQSLLSIVRMLRNGKQSPVKLTITKLRTKESFARMIGNHFECDSAEMIAFLNTPDSINRFNVKGNTLSTEEAMAVVLPDTYTMVWNTTPGKIYRQMVEASSKFWTDERMAKAKSIGLETPAQVSTLASIVEEETNADAEKGNIASTYLNRIKKGMPLQADPTVKFALRDFGLKRIYEKHTAVESPYNTYRNKGLPPGPICTPSRKTIEAVLNAPATDYMFFVANPAFNGTHLFASNYQEQMKNARAYHDALDKQDSIRKSHHQQSKLRVT